MYVVLRVAGVASNVGAALVFAWYQSWLASAAVVAMFWLGVLVRDTLWMENIS